MRRFKPVHLPDDRALHGRASQTFLRHYAQCPRSGYLQRLHGDRVRTAEMERGRGLHAIAQRSIQAALEQGEPVIPPELVKVIADEVLADSEFAIPFEEHDRLREMSYRLGSELAIDPGAVVAVETLFVLDVGGFEVRCRIDFAELVDGGAVVKVMDWKSSMAAPGFEEVARKRPDGTLAAKQFQLVLYALALAFGVPVREEECAMCALAPEDDCGLCGGSRRVEIREPFPVASRAQRFDLEYVFAAIEDRDEKMVRRPVSLSRLELEEYRASLEGLLARVAESERSGDWPAVVSDAACGECPCAAECPIPVELRDFRGAINSGAEAAEAFELASVVRRLSAAMQKERRAFVKANGPVRFGNGMVAEIGHQSSDRIVDKDGMFAAQERAVRYGEPFERHRWVKTVESFPLVERELSVDELAAYAAEEAQDGEDDGRGSGTDRGLDERFGADAPF